MALMNQFDLKAAVMTLPTRKLSGGQRKIPEAIFVDDPNNRTLTKAILIKKLVMQPFYPHGRQVVCEFKVKYEGVEHCS